jgi:hypothetical protein
MQEIHKGRQNSEAKRKSLLVQVALLRTEARELGAEIQLLERIDAIEQGIQSARVDVRKHRDFLREENDQVETVQQMLHTMKETKRNNSINQVKMMILIFLLAALPNIFLSKMYYLSLVPKHIPTSSVLIYLGMGDILFYAWILIYILYSLAYRYITLQYVDPFIQRNPPLKIPIKLCSASLFICFYGQFLFYSASLLPKLIHPSWGPSVVNVFHVIIALLTSSPLTAVTVLISIWPLVGYVLKKSKKYKLFRFRRSRSA